MTKTVPQVFEHTARKWGDRPAMRSKRAGAWHDVSWSGYHEQVLRAARGLITLGVEPGAGVAIIGFNRAEWFVADVGAIFAGGLPAGIYTTSTPEQCAYIAGHCEAAVAVVENDGQLAKFLEIRGSLPHLRAIVLMEGESDAPGVFSWSELLERGEETPESVVRERVAAQKSGDLCTLIYTSGTTGPPKAVMLSHHNIVWVAREVVDTFGISSEDEFLSYLPLSHIAEQMISLHGTMAAGATSCFAESLEKLAENLREVRPHVFFGVPRVWEKIQSGIAAAGARNSPLKRRIAAWARRKGLAGGYAEQRGESRPAFYGLADRLVFSKVRQKLGLDRARICATAAAPISLDTLEFFLSLGIPILEIYGMSECTGPATMSAPDRYRTGKAGYTIPRTEIKIASDGEICMRGPHVFLGYYKDKAATREALDDEGWLHSGDIGELDDEGFLRITDRKKELIVTSGGKNVAPQMLEAKLKSIPAIGQAVLIGDRRNYLTALVTLDPERLAAEAERAGSPARGPEAASQCPELRAHLQRQVDEINATLASYETIKKFSILGRELSIVGGELTPTMKLKRRVVNEKYAAEIDRLYK